MTLIQLLFAYLYIKHLRLEFCKFVGYRIKQNAPCIFSESGSGNGKTRFGTPTPRHRKRGNANKVPTDALNDTEDFPMLTWIVRFDSIEGQVLER